MAPSDHFEAILALGQKLADELGDERQTSTLARWMAHYIAELMEEERVIAPALRDGKRAQIADIVLKLWAHNSHFANGQRPFEEFEPVLRTMESLDPESSDYRYHQIWQSREPLTAEEKVAQRWLEAARGIDNSARILLRLFLRQAAHNAVDKAAAWVELATRAGLEQDQTVRVVRFIIDGDKRSPEEDQYQLRRKRAEHDIERLESFSGLAASLAADLRQQLVDGS